MSFFCTLHFDKPVAFETAYEALELMPEWCRTTGMPGRGSYLDLYREDTPEPFLHMGGSYTYAGQRLLEFMIELAEALGTMGYTCTKVYPPYEMVEDMDEETQAVLTDFNKGIE